MRKIVFVVLTLFIVFAMCSCEQKINSENTNEVSFRVTEANVEGMPNSSSDVYVELDKSAPPMAGDVYRRESVSTYTNTTGDTLKIHSITQSSGEYGSAVTAWDEYDIIFAGKDTIKAKRISSLGSGSYTYSDGTLYWIDKIEAVQINNGTKTALKVYIEKSCRMTSEGTYIDSLTVTTVDPDTGDTSKYTRTGFVKNPNTTSAPITTICNGVPLTASGKKYLKITTSEYVGDVATFRIIRVRAQGDNGLLPDDDKNQDFYEIQVGKYTSRVLRTGGSSIGFNLTDMIFHYTTYCTDPASGRPTNVLYSMQDGELLSVGFEGGTTYTGTFTKKDSVSYQDYTYEV